MLKNRDIICISSIDWDFIWQGHQEIMSRLAAQGNRVIFIENTGVRAPGIRDIARLRSRIKNYCKGTKGIRQENNNLYIFSPLVLPFPYFFAARAVNKWLLTSSIRRWMKVMDFADPILFTFLPTPTALDIINAVNKSLTVYYCIDNFAASSASVKKIKRTEKKLLEIADLVFVTSKALYDYCSRGRRNTYVFPFGVNIDNFEKARALDAQAPADLKTIKPPIIGYVGGIHKWIDFSLIKKAALLKPCHSFVFVGPVQTDITLMQGLPNVHFLGGKAHKDLPYYVKYFSCALIPYLITDYTKNVYPTKLNEYLAMGTPVVSTALPEIVMFNQKNNHVVRLADTAEQFCRAIDAALADNSNAAVEARVKIACLNSWEPRIEQMCDLMEDAINTKKLDKEKNWKKNIFIFYRASQKRLAGFALACTAAYMLVFYTPLLWFLARPLKIQDSLYPADVIAVFAGGVGESGKWGQGYEERVQYAVQLYKQKYARNLIFSSGYTYVFKETQVMKALAISLGIPAEAITLEDKSIRTYENVLHTKEILEKNHWHSVLVVSSPYHMRRVALVFNKLTPAFSIAYTPVPQSLFYSHPRFDASGKKTWKRITLAQINGILHEYIGIIYYWIKGWI